MKTIGLCMIVKDEEHVIERCLESVRSLVDYVLVCDTGSTDETQTIIRNYLAEHQHLSGEVINDPWCDFGTNRTRALIQLRGIKWVDYALMMDADDQLILDPGFDPAAFK